MEAKLGQNPPAKLGREMNRSATNMPQWPVKKLHFNPRRLATNLIAGEIL
jgi:hypothetical protein